MFLEGTMKRDIKTHKTKSIDKSRNTGTGLHTYKYTGKPPAWNAEAILYKDNKSVYTRTYIHWI